MVKNVSMLNAVSDWLLSRSEVEAAVLFGSHAREGRAADQWSDIDLHLIVRDPPFIEQVFWPSVFKDYEMCLSLVRPATGDVRKVTVVFTEGEIDMVLVPLARAEAALQSLVADVGDNDNVLKALNILSTILAGGYKFIKGEARWAEFYNRVAKLAGVRLSDGEISQLANSFLADMLWIFNKLARGELVACQRVMHRSLLETNIVLMHELRLREGRETYQQARRVEFLLDRADLENLRLSFRLEREEIREAAWSAFRALRSIMRRLLPDWCVAPEMERLLVRLGSK